MKWMLALLPDFNNLGVVMHGRYQIRHLPLPIASAIWERLCAQGARAEGCGFVGLTSVSVGSILPIDGGSIDDAANP